MKFSLLVLATAAATVLAAPTEPAELAHLARDTHTPDNLIVTTNDDGLSASATRADNNDDGNNAEERRDLAVRETHDLDLAKRWWGDGGWISCGGQWWEYGKKRVAIQYTGIVNAPAHFYGLLIYLEKVTADNFQGWWRTDKNVWEINWGFPEKETAKQIQVWKSNYGITCRW